jgi:hypothetical protein
MASEQRTTQEESNHLTVSTDDDTLPIIHAQSHTRAYQFTRLHFISIYRVVYSTLRSLPSSLSFTLIDLRAVLIDR